MSHILTELREEERRLLSQIDRLNAKLKGIRSAIDAYRSQPGTGKTRVTRKDPKKTWDDPTTQTGRICQAVRQYLTTDDGYSLGLYFKPKEDCGKICSGAYTAQQIRSALSHCPWFFNDRTKGYKYLKLHALKDQVM